MLTLLVVIYIAFISLGLPDSVLGAAWPSMRIVFDAPLSYAGIVSMIIASCTVISSLLSARLIRRFRTGLVTLVSVAMTAVALLGFALSQSFWLLCLLAVPLGLGAGSVDAALNNFVANHYKARHMNWLHCFWGVGATLGPVILSACLSTSLGWRGGYGSIAILQFVLTLSLFISLPLWKRQESPVGSQEEEAAFVSNKEALRLPGIVFALLTFFCYCAAESSTGLWATSFLVEEKGLTEVTAALWGSLFYGGITVGRLVSGFMTSRFSSTSLIRIGWITCLAGVVLLLLPLPVIFCMFAFILIGLGCAPIYPAMIQLTPARFGKAASQAAMGLQMAVAYVGSTLMPPLVGAMAGWLSMKALPWFLLALFTLLAVASQQLNRCIPAAEPLHPSS